jgi:hypothetical protein
MSKAGVVALSAVLLSGAAACGGDDDDSDASEDTTPTADEVAADPAAYCEDLLEFNTLVFDVELDEDSTEDEAKEVGEQLAPMFGQMVDSAPPEVRDAASDLNETAIQPLLDGDAAAFNSDETFEAYTALVGDSTEVCGFEEVAITAVDYAFGDVPATLAAGQYSFKLENLSEAEGHEVIVFRKADGVTQSIEEILNLPEEESESLIVFKGAAFAEPGQEGGTLTDLDPGAYGLVCFIPVGGGEDGPPHFTEGMFAEFTVE